MRKLLVATVMMSGMSSQAHADDRDPESAGIFWQKPVQICQEARHDVKLTSDQKLQICNQVNQMMTQKYLDPKHTPKSDYEANFYWFSKASLYASIQGIYGDIDGTRSRRVCTMLSQSMTAMNKIKQRAWPEKYQEISAKALESYKGPYEKCRAELG